eukprot:77343-Pyramimonas_sp.AAC.1
MSSSDEAAAMSSSDDAAPLPEPQRRSYRAAGSAARLDAPVPNPPKRAKLAKDYKGPAAKIASTSAAPAKTKHARANQTRQKRTTHVGSDSDDLSLIHISEPTRPEPI